MSQEFYSPHAEEVTDLYIDGTLTNIGLELDNFSFEVDVEGANGLPDWWDKYVDELSKIKSLLITNEVKPDYISRFYDVKLRMIELSCRVKGRNPGSLANILINDLGSDIVSSGFLSESDDGPIHKSILSSLSGVVSGEFVDATAELEVLRKSYGCEKITDLLGVEGGAYENNIHKLIIEPDIIFLLRHSDQQKKADETWADYQDYSRQWMADALELATGITNSEAMDYVFSASRLGRDDSLSNLIKKFDYFGIDRIRRLTETTGIVGLDAYSISQIERMNAFCADPEGFSDSLKNNDISVVMINRVGDYNGIMNNTAQDLDDSHSARMLFFEIASTSDILKTMAKLNKYSIKPSTLVVSTHSTPGQFIVSDERLGGSKKHSIASVVGKMAVESIIASPNFNENIKIRSIDEMKSVARIIRDYMADSKGVDDCINDLGRRKIILQSCYTGVEIDYDYNDIEGIPTKSDSVISKLAKNLISSGVLDNVDIYGAPTGVQAHGTESGLYYSSNEKTAHGSRNPVEVVCVSLDGGRISKKNVKEIRLRNMPTR